MAEQQQFDVVVIGGGPGGYIAAIRAAQLGLHDRLHRRLEARRRQARAGRHLHQRRLHSVEGAAAVVGELSSTPDTRSPTTASGSTGLSIDVAKMLARKDKVVKQNNDGIVYLFKKNKVAFFHGRGAFAGKDGDRWRISVEGPGAATLAAQHVIVATGSKPRALPGVAFDNERVLDNDGALAIPDVPKRLGVVGAGVIGLEMGSVWRRLGAEVTVLEALPAFLGAADEAVAKEAQKASRSRASRSSSASRSATVDVGKDDVSVDYTDAKGEAQTLDVRPADRLDRPRAEHRRPRRRGGRPASSTSAASSRSTTTAGPTSPNVWAIGDVVRGPMLAHKAEERASRWPSASPASTATSTSTRFRG